MSGNVLSSKCGYAYVYLFEYHGRLSVRSTSVNPFIINLYEHGLMTLVRQVKVAMSRDSNIYIISYLKCIVFKIPMGFVTAILSSL